MAQPFARLSFNHMLPINHAGLGASLFLFQQDGSKGRRIENYELECSWTRSVRQAGGQENA